MDVHASEALCMRHNTDTISAHVSSPSTPVSPVGHTRTPSAALAPAFGSGGATVLPRRRARSRKVKSPWLPSGPTIMSSGSSSTKEWTKAAKAVKKTKAPWSRRRRGAG